MAVGDGDLEHRVERLYGLVGHADRRVDHIHASLLRRDEELSRQLGKALDGVTRMADATKKRFERVEGRVDRGFRELTEDMAEIDLRWREQAKQLADIEAKTETLTEVCESLTRSVDVNSDRITNVVRMLREDSLAGQAEPGCGVGGDDEPEAVMLLTPLAAMYLSKLSEWETVPRPTDVAGGRVDAHFSGFPVRVMGDWNDYMPPTVVNEPEPAGAEEGYRIVRTPYTVTASNGGGDGTAALAAVLRAEALTRHLAAVANAASQIGTGVDFYPGHEMVHRSWDNPGGSIAGEWLTELVIP